MTTGRRAGWAGSRAVRRSRQWAPWLVLFAIVGVRAETTSNGAPSVEEAALAASDELAKQAFQILKANCLECHGETKRGGLDLRTPDSLLAGGAKGRVVIPHDPEKSRLYQYATTEHEGRLPLAPDAKISEADLETLRAWIEAGGSLAGVLEAGGRAGGAGEKPEDRPFKPGEREYWAFKVPVRVAPPAVKSPGWNAHPIDRFLAASMEAKGLRPSAPADRRTLIRRAYLDLTGLPPDPGEVEAFVNDKSPRAWETVVDRLLASPHYGERWARHWMDLVRYADSGGFEFDTDRPQAYRYRDYLVRSFNEDKPYDQFIKEQIAGDEYAPGSDVAMTATGFLRLGPSGGNRQDQLDDLLSTTSLTFMGLTVGCARCHNHKFDPIPQKDYYRLQSIFFSTRPVEHPLVPAHEVEANRREASRIDAQQRPLRDAKRKLEAPFMQQILDREIAKLPDYMQLAWKTPPEKRTEGQKLNVIQIEKTISNDTLRALVTEKDVVALMPDDVKAKHADLSAQIAALEAKRPAPFATAQAIGERGRVPQPSFFLHRGSPDNPGSQVAPGVLSVVSETEWPFPEPPADATSSWRRRGLAEWLVWKDNPLTARVMVNRLWQHHFGEGIVRTPGNLGKLGDRPSHAELLDWLALELQDRQWSLKAMHRLMMTSRAYQMASVDIPANVTIDPENRQFWRAPRVRLEAEIIRDGILAVAGTLDRTVGGPSVFPYIDPDLFEASSKRNWPGKADTDPTTWRRSIYVYLKRSIRYPMFETFDQPNLVNSADRRNRTVIAPQALILMNNGMVLLQAEKFAERLEREAGSDRTKQIDRAFRLALARPPDAIERRRSLELVSASPDGLARFCHAIFNLSEFVYRQ
jgi:mono/diheme cytochrome c family protein